MSERPNNQAEGIGWRSDARFTRGGRTGGLGTVRALEPNPFAVDEEAEPSASTAARPTDARDADAEEGYENFFAPGVGRSHLSWLTAGVEQRQPSNAANGPATDEVLPSGENIITGESAQRRFGRGQRVFRNNESPTSTTADPEREGPNFENINQMPFERAVEALQAAVEAEWPPQANEIVMTAQHILAEIVRRESQVVDGDETSKERLGELRTAALGRFVRYVSESGLSEAAARELANKLMKGVVEAAMASNSTDDSSDPDVTELDAVSGDGEANDGRDGDLGENRRSNAGGQIIIRPIGLSRPGGDLLQHSVPPPTHPGDLPREDQNGRDPSGVPQHGALGDGPIGWSDMNRFMANRRGGTRAAEGNEREIPVDPHRPTLNGRPIPNELWQNPAWRERFEGSQLVGMLERATEEQLDGDARLLRLKAAAPHGSQSPEFWQAIDEFLPAGTPDERIGLVQSMVTDLEQRGVSREVPPTAARTETAEQRETREANEAKSRIKDYEQQQLVIAGQLKALWQALPSDRRTDSPLWVLKSLAALPANSIDVPSFVAALRKSEQEFNDRRVTHMAMSEVSQAKQLVQQLQEAQQILAKRLESQPGSVQNALLKDELAQRAQDKAPGREGQSIRPTGLTELDAAAARNVPPLDEAMRQRLVAARETRQDQREAEAMLDRLQRLGAGASVDQVRRAIGEPDWVHGGNYSSMGRITSREQFVVAGNKVVEIVKDEMGNTAVGLANVNENRLPTDHLVATVSGIERTNMPAFEARHLFDEANGLGPGAEVLIKADDGTILSLRRHKNKWLMEGRPVKGKPFRRVETDVNVRKFAWQIGGPTFPGVAGRVQRISLVYPHSVELQQDPAVAQQLTKEAALAGPDASLVKELRGGKMSMSQRLKKFLAED